MITNEDSISEATDNTSSESVSEEANVKTHEIPFMEMLPQAIRDMQIMKDVNDSDSFVNRITELSKGPEIPEQYDFNIPDGLQPIPNLMEEFSSVAKDVSLTQKQASKMLELWHTAQTKLLEENSNRSELASKTLQSEWAKDYDKNVSLAKKALKHFGDEDFINYLDTSGLGNHVPLIKTFKAIGAAISEDSMVGFNSGGKPSDIDRWNGMPLLNFKM